MALLAGFALAVAAGGDLGETRPKQNVTDELNSITKSLEDLLAELTLIKREATGRLSLVKNRVAATDESSGAASSQEQIRQTKVSRFVLKRVAELESESLSMRDELAKLFAAGSDKRLTAKLPALYAAASVQTRQEDLGDFDEPAPITTEATSSTTQGPGMPATSTIKPDDEAAKIGFDMEALKKLGEEIGKRLDQFGKEAAKNLNDLIEGVKLVFREPASRGNRTTTTF